MGNAERRSDAAGIVNVLARTAGALAAHRFAMIVKLQRDADHIIARCLQQRGGDGGINPARHGAHDPVPARVSGQCHRLVHETEDFG